MLRAFWALMLAPTAFPTWPDQTNPEPCVASDASSLEPLPLRAGTKRALEASEPSEVLWVPQRRETRARGAECGAPRAGHGRLGAVNVRALPFRCGLLRARQEATGPVPVWVCRSWNGTPSGIRTCEAQITLTDQIR